MTRRDMEDEAANLRRQFDEQRADIAEMDRRVAAIETFIAARDKHRRAK